MTLFVKRMSAICLVLALSFTLCMVSESMQVTAADLLEMKDISVQANLAEPQGIAVNAAGTVYVADTAGGKVKVKEQGSPDWTTLPATGLDHPLKVQLDAEGNIYVLDQISAVGVNTLETRYELKILYVDAEQWATVSMETNNYLANATELRVNAAGTAVYILTNAREKIKVWHRTGGWQTPINPPPSNDFMNANTFVTLAVESGTGKLYAVAERRTMGIETYQTPIMEYTGSTWEEAIDNPGRMIRMLEGADGKIYMTASVGATVNLYALNTDLTTEIISNLNNTAMNDMAIDSEQHRYWLVTNESVAMTSNMGQAAAAASSDPLMWSLLGGTEVSNGTSFYPSIALDSQDVPYVGFIPKNGAGAPVIKKYAAGIWEEISTDNLPDDVMRFTLAFDQADQMFAVLEQGTGVMTVWRKPAEEQEWVSIPGQVSTAHTNSNTTLAIASDGQLYVAYRDAEQGIKMSVKTYKNGAWEYAGQAGFTQFATSGQNIVIDANDRLYAVANEQSATNTEVRVYRLDGAAWVAVGHTGLLHSTAAYPFLAIQPEENGKPGKLHLAYSNRMNSLKANVIAFDGTSWERVGNADLSLGSTASPMVDFADDGTAYIAYLDYTKNTRPTIMKLVNDEWEQMGERGILFRPHFSDFAVASDGTPYYVSNDLYDSGKMKVISNQPFSSPSLLTPPLLNADSSSNDPAHAIELSFLDDADWRAAITTVKADNRTLAKAEFEIYEGILLIQAGVLEAGNYTIKVEADGYHTASVQQQIVEIVLLLGDINGDGFISPADVLLVNKHIAGKIALSDEQLARADINGDGVIDAADAQLMMDIYLGKVA
jgi:hypothetical protein